MVCLPGDRRPNRFPGEWLRRGMTPSSDTRPPIEVTADARELLRSHVDEDPVRNRFIRIHVGRG